MAKTCCSCPWCKDSLKRYTYAQQLGARAARSAVVDAAGRLRPDISRPVVEHRLEEAVPQRTHPGCTRQRGHLRLTLALARGLNHAALAAEGGEQAGIEAIDVAAQLQLAGIVHKSGLIGQVQDR